MIEALERGLDLEEAELADDDSAASVEIGQFEQVDASARGSSKFVAQENAFYINGGGNQDRPTARKDPFVHVDDVPTGLRRTFERGLKTSSE